MRWAVECHRLWEVSQVWCGLPVGCFGVVCAGLVSAAWLVSLLWDICMYCGRDNCLRKAYNTAVTRNSRVTTPGHVTTVKWVTWVDSDNLHRWTQITHGRCQNILFLYVDLNLQEYFV